MNGGPGHYLGLVTIVNMICLAWLGKRANAIAESLASSTQSAAIDLLANVIREIEAEPFEEPALLALARRLKGQGGEPTASSGMARLARISDWTDSRHNVFVRLSEIPILFTLQLGYASESWRRRHGARLRDWVDAVGDIEALLSLAGYSYEHPSYPFPEISEGTEGEACFRATEMAHPLLPAATAVSNSLTLSVSPSSSVSPVPPEAQVLIVSGSNMSGKSTLMRTVGMNALLALAGAPVRAIGMRLTPLAIGTCLRHTDSLQEHRSGFYTEALRIRAICDLLDGPLPVVFLFDELLSGTNSKDRRIAAEGVVRTMLSRGAIGIVTTHDLALTEIATMFPAQVKNVHLQDKVENGRMSFDYKLRDGVIAHSNALELMRMIGLDV
jgi:DNA mismatch repair ATPase MutS